MKAGPVLREVRLPDGTVVPIETHMWQPRRVLLENMSSGRKSFDFGDKEDGVLCGLYAESTDSRALSRGAIVVRDNSERILAHASANACAQFWRVAYAVVNHETKLIFELPAGTRIIVDYLVKVPLT